MRALMSSANRPPSTVRTSADARCTTKSAITAPNSNATQRNVRGREPLTTASMIRLPAYAIASGTSAAASVSTPNAIVIDRDASHTIANACGRRAKLSQRCETLRMRQGFGRAGGHHGEIEGDTLARRARLALAAAGLSSRGCIFPRGSPCTQARRRMPPAAAPRPLALRPGVAAACGRRQTAAGATGSRCR